MCAAWPSNCFCKHVWSACSLPAVSAVGFRQPATIQYAQEGYCAGDDLQLMCKRMLTRKLLEGPDVLPDQQSILYCGVRDDYHLHTLRRRTILLTRNLTKASRIVPQAGCLHLPIGCGHRQCVRDHKDVTTKIVIKLRHELEQEHCTVNSQTYTTCVHHVELRWSIEP